MNSESQSQNSLTPIATVDKKPKNRMQIDGKMFYKIKMLGRGAYGKVFKVRDDDNNEFAVKKVAYNEKEGVYSDIIKEMDFLRRFSNHPSIIELCGYKWDSKMFTMLMEFGGMPLHKFIDVYRTEYRMAVLPEILWQLLTTLSYVHKHKMCHRDIKPDNILVEEIIHKKVRRRSSYKPVKHQVPGSKRKPLISPQPQSQKKHKSDTPIPSTPPTPQEQNEEPYTDDERKQKGSGSDEDELVHSDEDSFDSLEDEIEINVKICDFGLSKSLLLKRNTPRTSTLWYRSPENLAEMKVYSTKIDVWAVGCVIYEYCTDEVLFEGESTKDTLLKVLRTLGPVSDRDYRRLEIDKSKLPKKWRKHSMIPIEDKLLEDLMMKCLTVNPDDRPTALQLLEHEYFTSQGYTLDQYHEELESVHMKDMCFDNLHQELQLKSHTNPINNSIKEILKTSRKDVLDWLFHIASLEGIDLKTHTLFLGIELFDRVMQLWDTEIDPTHLTQLKYISIGCLDIASKYLEVYSVDLELVYEHNNKQHYQKLRKEYDANPALFKTRPVAPRITREDMKEFGIKVNKIEQKILFLLDFIVYSSNPYLQLGEDFAKAKQIIYSRQV